MSSTFGGLNTAMLGLYAQRASLNTVGHNVANSSTDGYSRQSVNLTAISGPDIYGSGGTYQTGGGVTVTSVTRARDFYIDRQMWQESSTLSYSQSKQSSLEKIQDVFSEPSTTGVQSVLNKFWSSWQSLATNASDSGTRMEVREQGAALVNAIKQADQKLTDMVGDINFQIDAKVDTMNQISSGIYSLNKQISNIELGGADHANDLRDKRDLLVDQLSAITSVSVNEDQYGNYKIRAGNVELVSSTGYTKLAATSDDSDPTYGYQTKNVVVAGDTPKPVTFTDGAIKALVDSRDSTTTGVKAYMNQLDNISKFLLQDFNTVHQAGYGADNQSGRNFFGKDSGTNYITSPVADGKWVNELKVNPDLYDSAGGLDKIAAKTAINAIAVTQSNQTGSGAATVTTTGTYTGGTTATPVTVKIMSTDISNNVTGIQYSTDNGKTWSATIPNNGTAGSFTIPAPPATTINGLTVTVNIAANAKNTANDTYTFSLSSGNNASGDNALKLSNRLTSDPSVTLGNASLADYYSSNIGALGINTQDVQRQTANQQTQVDQIMNWREQDSGVNMDEEMANMIRFQQGYNSAARILTTMDEMLDKLINGTGTVGR
ncbi:MAG: flagellar hook-associated protein FlgK [Veillonellales bacterium]